MLTFVVPPKASGRGGFLKSVLTKPGPARWETLSATPSFLDFVVEVDRRSRVFPNVETRLETKRVQTRQIRTRVIDPSMPDGRLGPARPYNDFT